MSKNPKNTEVAVRAPETQALVEINAEELALFTSGSGLTDISKADIAIPFLQVLQSLSPQLDPQSGEYLEDAKPGQLFNTVTKELHHSVDIVVVDYRRSFTEWRPRAAGGGFRGEHGLDFEPVFEASRDPATGRAKLDNGNELVDSRNFYVLLLNEAGYSEPAMITMSSTQIKKAKQLVNMIQTYVPIGLPRRSYDPWAATYLVSSQPESNDKGRWYGWKIIRKGRNTNTSSMLDAQAFRQQVRGGVIVVDREQEVEVVAESDM